MLTSFLKLYDNKFSTHVYLANVYYTENTCSDMLLALEVNIYIKTLLQKNPHNNGE